MASVVRRSARSLSAPELSAADVAALSAAKNEPQWLRERRLDAWATYEAMPMPSPDSDEAWRRSDYRRIKWNEAGKLLLPNGKASLNVVPAQHRAPLVGNEHGGLIAYVDSTLATAELSKSLKQKGVIFTDLDTAVREHADLLQQYLMTTAVTPQDGKFAALNDALWTHGVLLYVPKGVHVELPLHSVFYPVSRGMTLGHILMVTDEGSEVTYMHEYASPEGDETMAFVGVTEIIVGKAANVRFVSLQEWGGGMWDFSHRRARVGRDGQLDWIIGSMGGRFAKIFAEVELDGEGSFARMSGLYFGDDRQFMDHDTQQNHNAAHTTSDLLFKGVLKDKARSVWQGMIRVLPGAQQTDGFQANRNLILNPAARADSIPGLEIEADDVRCTHAATVSQLDQEPIFYLMSRGITRREAEKLVVDGFFEPIMERIPFEGVVERLRAQIDHKLLGE